MATEDNVSSLIYGAVNVKTVREWKISQLEKLNPIYKHLREVHALLSPLLLDRIDLVVEQWC